MTLLYYDDRFLDHQTGQHPERAERLRHIMRHLAETGLDRRCERTNWRPVSVEHLEPVHRPAYIATLREFAAAGGGRIETDTLVSRASYDVALCAVGAACDAVERVVQGDDRQALCLVRPPGHHALKGAAMGFCLLNNVAVAARMATRQLRLSRVLIVDWDVHHGNGTQSTFWTDEQVGFLSIHRWPFYPGTGSRDETGAGDGLGTTLNLPIEFGTPRKQYLDQFADALTVFAKRIRPQLVIQSAGFDSHREDPIGSLGLESEDFVQLTRRVCEVAAEYAEGRLVSVLEGGYNPPVLAKCVELHLTELLRGQRPRDAAVKPPDKDDLRRKP